jgi:hypothetical protein
MLMFTICNPFQVCNLNHSILFYFYLFYIFCYFIYYCYMFLICSCFLVLTFMCNWFGSLFVKYARLFAAMKGGKQCLLINFLFWNSVNIVTYLNMGSHKKFNTRNIHIVFKIIHKFKIPFRVFKQRFLK